MKPALRITVLMDAACIAAEDPEFHSDATSGSTEFHVVNALRNLGNEVFVLGVKDNVQSFVTTLQEQNPDLVFNLTEEFRGNRRLDANIAAVLEMLDIAFTGSGSLGLLLCRGKALSKQLLSLRKIRVPGFVTLVPGRSMHVPKHLNYPMVVKPVYGDGSDGIANASLVKDEAALKERVLMIHERWKQPAIVEEYIDGRELYVGVLGNKRLTVLPPRELFFKNVGDNGDGPVLATYRAKWDEEYQKKWGIEFAYAKIEPPVMTKITRACKKVYRALQIHDYGRLDLRLTPENRIVIMEANANPDVAYGEELAESAAKIGIDYEEFISRIVRSALRRNAK